MIYINRQTNGIFAEKTKENYPRLFEGDLRAKTIDIVRMGNDIDIQTISNNGQFILFCLNEFLQDEKQENTIQQILQSIIDTIFKYLKVTNIKEADALSLLDSTMTYDLITDIIKELANKYNLTIKGL